MTNKKGVWRIHRVQNCPSKPWGWCSALFRPCASTVYRWFQRPVGWTDGLVAGWMFRNGLMHGHREATDGSADELPDVSIFCWPCDWSIHCSFWNIIYHYRVVPSTVWRNKTKKGPHNVIIQCTNEATAYGPQLLTRPVFLGFFFFFSGVLLKK